jgi:hypothetical protein
MKWISPVSNNLFKTSSDDIFWSRRRMDCGASLGRLDMVPLSLIFAVFIAYEEHKKINETCVCVKREE